MRLKVGLICLALAPLLIAASQPVRLQPSSPWDVDYAENSCRLIRNFGEGANLTKLAFESTSPGSIDMLVIGRPLASTMDEVQAQILPNGGKGLSGRVDRTVDGQPAILWSTIKLYPEATIERLDQRSSYQGQHRVRPPAVSLAQQAQEDAEHQAFADAATELAVETRPHHTVILETGSLGAAVKAFDQCDQDSLKDWGVDLQVEKNIVRPVWAENPDAWFSTNDYPRKMAWNGKESEVSVRLLVDATGRVTKCTSVSHFNEPDFNRITCDLITRRARFEPAELADGTKVSSYYAQRVNFRMAP
jgi:hypothetical protein